MVSVLERGVVSASERGGVASAAERGGVVSASERDLKPLKLLWKLFQCPETQRCR